MDQYPFNIFYGEKWQKFLNRYIIPSPVSSSSRLSEQNKWARYLFNPRRTTKISLAEEVPQEKLFTLQFIMLLLFSLPYIVTVDGPTSRVWTLYLKCLNVRWYEVETDLYFCGFVAGAEKDNVSAMFMLRTQWELKGKSRQQKKRLQYSILVSSVR